MQEVATPRPKRLVITFQPSPRAARVVERVMKRRKGVRRTTVLNDIIEAHGEAGK
jgi:hypothetical protein